jgi:hypothetical protein
MINIRFLLPLVIAASVIMLPAGAAATFFTKDGPLLDPEHLTVQELLLAFKRHEYGQLTWEDLTQAIERQERGLPVDPEHPEYRTVQEMLRAMKRQEAARVADPRQQTVRLAAAGGATVAAAIFAGLYWRRRHAAALGRIQ